VHVTKPGGNAVQVVEFDEDAGFDLLDGTRFAASHTPGPPPAPPAADEWIM
jgi:hypothetical protein